jgi:hypothetical protein
MMKYFWPKKSNKHKESAIERIQKLNPSQYLNKNKEYEPQGHRKEYSIEADKYLSDNFKQLFDQPLIDLNELKRLCSNGCLSSYRSRSWKILSNYVSPNNQKWDEELEQKRKEYLRLRQTQYDDNQEKLTSKRLQEGLNTIVKDVDRTLGETKMFQSPLFKEMLQRILFLYHVRNSESGYAQGMNDIAAPFLIIFTKEYIEVDEVTLKIDEEFESKLDAAAILNIEADSYWCFTRLLSSIKNNFTPGFPGVIEMIQKFSVLIGKLDPELDKTFKRHKIRLYDISFQWLLCLLLRQFPPALKFRLLDMYLTDKENINESLVYISAAFLMKFSHKLKEMDAFDKILSFFTNLVMVGWGELDMNMLLAEAHIYKNSYNYAEITPDNKALTMDELN